MTEGIDAVSDVVNDEDTHRTTPQESSETGRHRPSDRDPEAERHGKSQQRPQEERPVDEPDDRILDQVARVAVPGGAVSVCEKPPEMGVKKSSKCVSPPPLTTGVRAVRITITI